MSFRFDRFATLSVAQPLKAALGREEIRHLPILMYHSISDTAENDVAPYYRTVTSPVVFRTQMNALKESGWRGVTLAEGLGSLDNNSEKVGEKLVAITFDDGFEDFYTAAFPALRENGFSATMYLPTAFIGNKTEKFKNRSCLSWVQVRELHSQGVEYGSHTVNHPKLLDLPWPSIARELQDSKKVIEDQLGTAVPSFAYPYAFPQQDGPFTSQFRTELQKAGYQNCVTTGIGRVTSADDRLALNRLPANDCDDAALLVAKLDGAYDWLAWAQAAVKTMKTALKR